MVTSKFLNPKNDVAFRKIFGSEGHKDILIHFINDVLYLQGPDQIESVSFLSPVQEPDIACKKESIVDVLCVDQARKKIIVEMQVAPREGFEKRAQYYASKAYSGQLGVGQTIGSRYQDFKAVIFIAITDYMVFPDKKEYLSRHIILNTKTYAQDLKDFSFTFIELPKFNIQSIDLLSNMVAKWCYFFKYAASTSEKEVQKIIDADLVIQRDYEVLNRFNWSEIELHIYDQEIKRIMDNQAAEDYVKNRAREQAMQQGIEKGIEKGMEQGSQQGIEKGIQQGIEKGKIKGETEKALAIAKAMVDKQYAIEDILLPTGLSRTQIEELT